MPFPFLKNVFGFLLVEVAVVVQHGLWAVAPDADHLRGFFLQRHAREEVFGPLFGGKFGVLVGQ